MNGKKRKLIGKTDILIIVVAIAFAALFFFVNGASDNKTAVVTVSGKTVREVRLDGSSDGIIELDTTPAVRLEVKGGSIRFIDSVCHDHTCEKSGSLKNAGDTAACLPAKVVVTVRGEEASSVDGISF